MQRFFDILFSGLGILFLFPFFLLIGIFLLLTGEGEIFFLQDRVGINARKFRLIKFATMLKNSPTLGTGTVTIKNDPRILPFGKFLRSTKVNELPQLLNILLGQMSIIGPRPMTVETFSYYPLDVQRILEKIPPGLSGIGSIIFRCEEQILSQEFGTVNFYVNVIAPYKGSLEIWYAENKTLRIYFLLIALTLWLIFFPKSRLVWKIFPNLPIPPALLQKLINYPYA